MRSMPSCPPNGVPDHTGGDDWRRRLAHDVLRAHRPHIVLRQEDRAGAPKGLTSPWCMPGDVRSRPGAPDRPRRTNRCEPVDW